MLTEYLAQGLISLLAMSILTHMVHRNVLFEPRIRKSFLNAIAAIMVVVLAEMGTSYFTAPTAFSRAMNLICNIIGFSVAPFVPALIASAFMQKRTELGMILVIPSCINLCLVLLSPIWGLTFSVSPENIYARGSFFPVFIAAYLSSLAYLLSETVRMARRYQNKNRITLLWLSLLFLIGTMIQLMYPAIHSAWPCVSFTLILYYVYYCGLVETHDALTNLLNRRAYERHLRLLKEHGGAIILLDVDAFKRVNDSYGHPFGDALLKVIAETMRASFAKIGTCYRIGGDEFCVLCDTTEEPQLLDAETALVKNIAARQKEDPRLPSVSFGHAIYEKNRQANMKQAIAEADRQLFLYKETHKQQAQ